MSRLRGRRPDTDLLPSSTSLLDRSPVALIGAGGRDEITSWNSAATSLLGWQACDTLGRNLGDVLGPDAADRLHAGSGVTRTRVRVSTARGVDLAADLFAGGEAYSCLTSGERVIALVPIAAPPSSVEAGAAPAIDSWADAAAAIRKIGGEVQCVAVGLVGVEAVNRGYSRSIGDAVLREVAARLQAVVGTCGRVMRIGGNQFIVAAPASRETDVVQLVARISEPVDTRLGSIRVGCYAGSIVGDSASGLVLLDRADVSMRRARARGIGSVESRLVDGYPTGSIPPRLSSLLIDAVARREIAVTFQPVVELATGRIIEFEALARWRSDEMGDVDPVAFITAAEDAGLIHELGQLVLEGSLDVVRAEVRAGRWGSHRVSVNLSAVQLMHPDLPARVLDALSARELQASVLQLELTDTLLVPDIEFAAAQLRELRRHGVRIAIDDFGTGCANVSYLRDLPVDAIKIDRRFVAGMCASRADTAVIRSILALAAELHLDVIAEGIETDEQHHALTRLGCSAGQGFLYSRARGPAQLYEPVNLPEHHRSTAYPYAADEAARIGSLHRADILDTAPEEAYDEIVRAAASLCRTPIAMINLIDEDRQWTKAKVGIEVDKIPRDAAFCTHTICSDGLMEVPDTHADPRFASNSRVLSEPHVRFYAGAPLLAAAGYSYGTLCVMDAAPRALTADQRDGLTRLAHHATALLEFREAMNRVRRAERELEYQTLPSSWVLEEDRLGLRAAV